MSTRPTELTAEVEQLFDELIELSEIERNERLAQLASGDEALARRVGELIAASESAPEFLERPAAESELVGHAAGPWILEERLAWGGAGDVYRARRGDGAADWRVAVKVLKRRSGAAELARRFAAERSALAALNHPFIAPLVDGGVLPDGRPYLATKLVDGVPLDRYVVGASLEQRLRLFLSTCAAVQHAHERLIAHCDLKPANILVTREGLPQLLDFGIARLISGGEAEAERALTPGYASPEQLGGAVLGTASDVWSLGAVLYELATGQLPFAGAPSDALRPASSAVLAPAASRTSPVPSDGPAHLARKLRGDFDAIVAKSLALEPSARYGSVEQLARDLERYLEGRPVAARPASLARRTLLFARRNRLASFASLVALVSLALAFSGLYRGLLRTREEAHAGWGAHAEAALAARMIEDLARAARTDPGFEAALDDAARRLESEREVGGEAEGRLRISLGALYLDAGRAAAAKAQLERARAIATSTRGFGPPDVARIDALLERCAALLAASDGAGSQR